MKRNGSAATMTGPGVAFSLKPAYLLIILLLGFFANAHSAWSAGGDITGQWGDALAGKQQANASAVDSAGNVVVTGLTNSGGANDNYYTAKFKADGSGIAWSVTYDKAGGSDIANAVAVDANDDVIVVGYVWNGLNNDIHTIKYNGATGAVIWQHTFNGTAAGGDYGTAVTVDALNNVYVAGYSANAGGNDDFILLKYSPGGTSPLWQAVYNGTANGIDRAVAVAAGAGGIAVTGYSWNGTDFDCLTALYGPSGNKIWEARKAAAGVRDDRGVAVRQDASGNVVVAGYVSNATDHDIYVAKYTAAAGAVSWEYTYPGSGGDDEPQGLSIDGAGDIFVAGSSWTPTGSFDIYTVRFTAVGSKSWERVYNSNNGDDDIPVAVVADAAGNVFVSGYSFVQSTSNFDFRTLKLSKDSGNVLWSAGFNGAAGKNEKAVGAAVAPGNGIYAIGWSDMWTSGVTDYDYYVIKYDAGALNAPSALTSTVVGNDAVNLAWTDNSSNEDGFKVERKQTDGGAWTQIATVLSGVTTYSDTGLAASTRYYYRVRAHNAANGNSLYTNEVSAYTLLVAPVAPAWTYTYGGTTLLGAGDDYATGIAVGPDNHPVVTGYSNSTNEGLDSFNFFTIKVNKDNKADIKWTRLYDNPGNETDISPVVAVDRNNDVVVAGTSRQYGGGAEDTDDIFSTKYNGTSGADAWGVGTWYGNGEYSDKAKVVVITDDGTNKVYTVGEGLNAGGTQQDIKVMKYNANGTNAWTAPVAYDGGTDDYATSAVIDPAGNLMVTGYRLVSGVKRWVTLKFAAADGAILWSKTFDGVGAGPDEARAVGVDKSGNAYVAGFVVNGAGNEDYYTIRYNSADGTIGWQMPYDGAAHGSDRAMALKVDPIDEMVVVSGHSYVGPGDYDVRSLRYAPVDGSEKWTAALTRPTADERVVAMGMDSSGNFFVTGTTTATANDDIFSIKYGYDGTLLGMATYVNANAEAPTGIAVNGYGEAFVAGYTHAAGGDADYVVYKVASTAIQAPLPLSSVPDYAKIVFNWTDNSSTETGYTVQRKLGACTSTNPWVDLATTAANVVTYTDNLLNPTTTYCYRVRAFSATEQSRWGEKAFTTLTPTPPGTFAATMPSTTQINLTWTDNTTGEGGFVVERCTGSNCDFSTVDATFSPAANAVSYNDTSVCAGTTYSYRMKAIKTGEWVTAWTTLANQSTAAAGVPSALASTPASEVEISLAWTDNSSDETGFKIERCTGAGCSGFSQIATVAAGVTTFKDSMAAPGNSYSYRIRSYKTASCVWDSAYSATATAATAAIDPAGLTATAASTTEINLAWNDNTGSETGFRIDRCLGAGCNDFAPLTMTGPNATAYKDAVACNGSTYSYRVVARNEGLSGGNGGCWTRRKPMTTISAFQSDFQTKVTVAYDSDMNADFSDVRFYDETALRELPYWLETKANGSSATFWIKTTRSMTVSMYYGNPSATGTGNGSRVFEIFDGFDSLAAWTQSGGTITAANSTAILDYGNSPVIYRNFTVASPYSVEIRYQHPTSYRNRLYLTTAAGGGSPIPFDYGVFSNYMYWNGTNVVGLTNNEWYVLRWDNTATDYIWTMYNNTGSAIGTRSYGQPVAGLSRMYIAGTESTSSDMVLDWFRVRKYAGSDPVGILGVEESSGCYAFGGTWDSNPTAIAQATTGIPVAPGAISSATVSEVQINLSWTDTNSDEGAYVVERCPKESGSCIEADFSQIASLAPGTTSFSSTGLLPSTTYTYRVKATKNSSCGWSTSYSVTSATTATIPAPTGMSVSSVNTTTLRPAWTDNTGSETAFQLERCSGAGCSIFAKIAELDPNTSSYDDTTVCSGTSYSYRVRAVNEGLGRGNGGCWTRRMPVTISNFQANFQMKVTVAYDADMKADFSDLRFYDVTDSKELPFYIESKTDGATATMWIRTGNNNTIYAYYGNASAAASGSAANVFDFYDDFTGSAIDTAKWTVNDATGFSVSGGFLHGTNTTGRITSKTSYSAGTVLEVKAKTTTIPTNGVAIGGFYTNASANIGWLNHPGNAYYVNNGAYTANATQTPTANILYTMVVLDASTVNLQVYNLDTSAMFWNIGNLSQTLGSKPIALGRRYDSDGYNGQAYATDWDWVRVRKYAATAPSAATGAEEQSGCFTFAVTWNSNYSGTASVTSPTPTLPTLTATRGSESTINLSWNNSTTDETGFAVQRCTGSGCVDFADLTTTATDVITYADSVVAPATTYTYRVAPLKTASCSWPVTYSTAAAATTTVTGPSGLTATTVNSTQVNLAWTDNTGSETAFRIERCAGAGCSNFAEITTVKADTTTYSDTSVCNATLYRYQVRATNSGLAGSGGGCWTVRAPLTITNFQPNHQTKLVVPWRTGMQSDFRDVRFYDAVHQRELPYYIESKTNGVTATMWVKTRANNSIFMYYGNAAAVAGSNGNDTFELFDDFTGTTVDTTKWTLIDPNGNYSQNNEFIVSGGTASWNGGIHSVKNFTRPFVMEFQTYVTGGAEAMLGVKDNSGAIPYNNFTHVFYLSNTALFIYEDGNSRGTVATITGNTWQQYRVEALTVGARYYFGNVGGAMTKYYDNTTYGSVSTLKVGFANASRAFKWDNVIVRKYAAVDPTVAIGSDETSGCFAIGTWDTGYSTIAQATTTTPPTPTLTLTRISEAQLNLSWTDGNTDETGFRVERCSGASCSGFAEVTTTAPNGVTFVDYSVQPLTDYSYRVASYKTATCSWTSNTSAVKTATTTVSAPTALAAVPANTTTINLSWTDNAGAESGHTVQRCTGAACSDFATIAQVGQNVTTYADTGVCNTSQYRYRVTAKNEGMSFSGGGCWTRRAPVTIANFQPNFQVRLVLPYDSDMKADFSDIRFYDGTFLRELPYWIESKTDGVSAIVWLKTGLNNNIYLYYGNANATASNSNGTNVFEAFDDFTGTSINSSRWTQVGSYFTQNEQLINTGGSGGWTSGIYTVTNFARPFIVEFDHYFDSGNYAMVGLKNTGAGVNYTDLTYAQYLIYDGGGNRIAVYEAGTGRGDNLKALASGSWQYFRFDVLPSVGATYYHGTTRGAYTTVYNSAYSAASPLKFGISVAYESFKIDNFRVRKYAAVVPTLTVGAEEASGCYPFTGTWTSGDSNIATATTVTPGPPTALVATASTDTRVNLTWTDNTSDESGFRIERCAGAACSDFAQIATTGPNVATYSDTTASPSTTYRYQVRTTKTATCGWDTPYAPVAADQTFAATAGSLTATPLNSLSIKLDWVDNAVDEEGYEVQMQAANGKWAQVTTLPADAETYTQRFGLDPALAYNFRVRPYRGADKSPFTSTATATTPAYQVGDTTCP